jgi:hypothetical protein
MATDSHRVNVALVPAAEAALDEAKSLSGNNTTDTVNRAIQVYLYYLQVSRAGGLYSRETPDGELYRIEFL